MHACTKRSVFNLILQLCRSSSQSCLTKGTMETVVLEQSNHTKNSVGFRNIMKTAFYATCFTCALLLQWGLCMAHFCCLFLVVLYIYVVLGN